MKSIPWLNARFIPLGLMISLFSLLHACKPDEPEPPKTESITVRDLPADTIIGITPGTPPTGGIPFGAGKFTFYSLENNAVVPSTDSASNGWDLAFRGTTIITNSGSSGPGMGGAFVWNGLFDELFSISSDSTFGTDNAPNYAIPTGSGRGWYTYAQAEQLVRPIPGKVLVVRTALGKYAKVEILNYYKGGITPAVTETDSVKYKLQRYYTFRYRLQKEGSKNF
ncbi:MAG: HmuY family protein [Bacteroidota bacterium]